jgi:hypothetical protein
MSSYITSLIKFTDFPEDFVNGDLFCNTWEYFEQLEKRGIGDSSEMTQSILKTVYVNEASGKKYSTRLVDSDLMYSPIFCMSAIYSKKFKQESIVKIPKRISDQTGDYKAAVIITDVKEFLGRINKRLPYFCYSPIDYIDYGNIFGKTIYQPILKKDKGKFGFQQEFRIYCQTLAITRKAEFDIPGIEKNSGIEINGNLAAKFSIGDISDIAKEFGIDEINSGVKIDLNIDWNYCHNKNLRKL